MFSFLFLFLILLFDFPLLFGCSDGLDDCWDVVCDDFNLVAAMAAHI